MMMGSTMMARVRPPDSTDQPNPSFKTNKTKPKRPEDDGGHPRQAFGPEADDPGGPAFPGVFRQVNGGSHSQGGGQHNGQQGDIGGGHDGGEDAAGPAHVGGILGEKRRGNLGQALHGDVDDDKDEDQQGETGKGPEQGLYQALGEVGIESHGPCTILIFIC